MFSPGRHRPNLNIYKVWCLDSEGRPNCPSHTKQNTIFDDLILHCRHLQTEGSGEVNEIYNYITVRGQIEPERLQEMLEIGDSSCSGSCCPILDTGTPSHTRKRKPRSEKKWRISDELQSEWFTKKGATENTLDTARTLEGFPWERVNAELELASGQRQMKGGRGSAPSKELTPKDCQAVAVKLRAEYLASYSFSTDNASVDASPIDQVPIASPATKRPRIETHSIIVVDDEPDLSNPLPYVAKQDLRTLDPGGGLNGHVIYSILSVIERCVGQTKAKVINPMRTEQQYLDISESALIVLPLLVRTNHWLMAIVSNNRRVVTIYDSFSVKDRTEAHEQLLQFYSANFPAIEPEFENSSPLRHSNAFDCGIFAVMAGIYRMTGQRVPEWVDADCCRRLFGTLLGSFETMPADSGVNELQSALNLLDTLFNDEGVHFSSVIGYIRASLDFALTATKEKVCSRFAAEGLALLQHIKDNKERSVPKDHEQLDRRLQACEETLQWESRRRELREKLEAYVGRLSRLKSVVD